SVRSVHVPTLLTAPVRRAGSLLSVVSFEWKSIIPDYRIVDSVLAPASLLVGTGFIYSLLDPEAGFNEKTLTLFVSLVISQGILAVGYEGGKAFLYRHSLRGEASVRLFPACILIAIVSVIISRISGLHPGIVV